MSLLVKTGEWYWKRSKSGRYRRVLVVTVSPCKRYCSFSYRFPIKTIWHCPVDKLTPIDQREELPAGVMMAITLWQPWATLIAIGAKELETRSWETDYRGPLAIHAAQNFPKEARALCYQEPFIGPLAAEATRLGWGDVDLIKSLPLGKIVANCDLVDCCPVTPENTPNEPERSFGNYSSGRFIWKLDDVMKFFDPIPAKGRQSLWKWKDPNFIPPKEPTVKVELSETRKIISVKVFGFPKILLNHEQAIDLSAHLNANLPMMKEGRDE